MNFDALVAPSARLAMFAIQDVDGHDKQTASGRAASFVETTGFLRLQRALEPGGPNLIFLAAAPGFGKTVLLNELRRYVQGFGWPAQSFDLATGKTFDPAALSEQIAQTGVRSYVFVDNFDQSDEANLAEKLMCCVGDGPAVYIIASRTLPRLNLLTACLNGRALLLRSRDLQMNVDEIRRTLQACPTQHIDPAIVTRVAQVTEGWPIAVEACGRFARDHGDWQNAIDRITRPEEEFFWYVKDTLLQQVDTGMGAFLTGLASLDQFSEPLCSYVLADLAPNNDLNDAIRSNLFLLPTAEDGWFRLHPLFRKVIQHSEKIARDLELSRFGKAFDWYLANDRPCEAAGYAMRVGDIEGAQRALVTVGPAALYDRNELAQVSSWVKEIKQKNGKIPFNLQILRIWSLIFSLQFDEANRSVAALERWLRRGFDTGESRDAAYLVEQLRCTLALRSDQMGEVFERATSWLQQYDKAPAFYRSAVAGALAASAFAKMQEVQFRRNLELAKQMACAAGSHGLEIHFAAFEAIAEIAYGHTQAAMLLNGQRRDGVNNLISMGVAGVSWAHSIASARVLCELGREEEAETHLAHALGNFETHGFVEIAIAGLEANITIAQKKAGSAAALVEARHFIKRACNFGRRFKLEASCAVTMLLLRNDDLTAAETEFEANLKESQAPQDALRAGDEDWEINRHNRMFVEAALLFARNQVEDALTICNLALQKEQAHGRIRRFVELYYLKAAALRKLGRMSAAMRAFSKAFETAAERDLFQATHEMGWAIRPFFSAFSPPPRAEDFARRVCERLNVCAEVTDNPATDLEPLTERELEVLALLDSGLTNEQMSKSLSVSLTTVKWHLKNIYSKLDVANRSGAVARARRFGLLAA